MRCSTSKKEAWTMRQLTGVLLFALFGCGAETTRVSIDRIESITVTLYKNKALMGVEDDFTLPVPKDDWDVILALILPYKRAEIGRDRLRIATVTIKYKDKKSASIDAFWFGKNPCIVSLNGKHFYYAKDVPGSPDGASGLIRKVIAIRSQMEREDKAQNAKK